MIFLTDTRRLYLNLMYGISSLSIFKFLWDLCSLENEKLGKLFDQFNKAEQHLCDLNSGCVIWQGGYFLFVSLRQLSLTHHDLAPWHQCRCYLCDFLTCMSLPSWSLGQELAACLLPSAGTAVCQAWILMLKCCLWLSIDPTMSAWERSTLSHSLHISDSQMNHNDELARLCWRLLRSSGGRPTPAQPSPVPSSMGCAEQELKTLLQCRSASSPQAAIWGPGGKLNVGPPW